MSRMSRCLIVDDSPTFRRVLRELLTGPDMEVVGEASDGEEAIARVRDLKPDVVTMDVRMPKKDGLTAIAEIMVRGIWHFCLATIPLEVSTSLSCSRLKVVLPNNWGVRTPPNVTITRLPVTSICSRLSKSVPILPLLALPLIRHTMFLCS